MRIKDEIKQLFCKHKYVEMKENSIYKVISGDTIYIVCEKCGKVKASYFRRYEGMGYK